jgi:CheY-like chemotaxis protein
MAPGSPGAQASGKQPPTILVVDDDPDIRETFETLLDMEGYRVRTAGDGRAALEALEKEPARLVLLDLMMPVMNGLETLARIRGSPRLSSIPVIVITAFGRMAKELEAKRLEAQGFFEKPCDFDALLAQIGRLVVGG